MKNTILISILLLSSCTFSSKKEMETIHLNDVGNIDKYLEWDISNKFDSLNYVLLETNDSILIADISNLRESAQDYFITSDDRLFRFDKQGHFCNFIGNRGSGPEEYVSIQDFCLDNQRQIVYILDYFGRKIMYYDFNGNYVGACKLIDDYAFNTFCFWEDHLYLTSVNNAFTPDLSIRKTGRAGPSLSANARWEPMKDFSERVICMKQMATYLYITILMIRFFVCPTQD